MESGEVVGGKYRLRHEIGEGSMGSVWAGVHELLGRPVAIKFLRPAFEDAETAALRFVAEAKAAARIKHRFVVDVFDFGMAEDGSPYMVQELLEGQSLAESMYHGPAWQLPELVRFAAQCLNGLEAVHQTGIVHRDLKPENIFVLRDGDERFPKLLDFGISKTHAASDKSLVRPSIRSGRPKRLTAVGATLGTPAYMSPEQLCNLTSLDGRADLYSMGVIMYEWLTGRCPFAATSNYAELYHLITQRQLVPLAALRPDLGIGLCKVIERALEPEADDRYASAAEMRQALSALQAGLSAVPSVVQKDGGALSAMGSATGALLQAAGDPYREAVSDAPHSAWKRRALVAGVSLVAVAVAVSLSWGRDAGVKATYQPKVAEVERTPAQAGSTRPSGPAQGSDVQASSPAAVSEAPPLAAAPPSTDELPLGADVPEERAPQRTEREHADKSSGSARAGRRAAGARDVPNVTDKAGAAEGVLPSPKSAQGGVKIEASPPIDQQKVIRDLDF